MDAAPPSFPLKDQAAGDPRLKATYWLFGVFLAVAAVGMLSRCADTTTELKPDRTDVVIAIAGWAGLTGGMAMIVAILWLKPLLRSSPLASMLVLGPISAMISALTTGSVAEVALEQLDFLQAPIARSSAYLPIRRAYVSSGKGWHYEVQLVDPFLTLDVAKRDYLAAFGTADDVREGGWCLYATVEQSGRAVRIVHGHRWPFAAGRPVRCPSPPGHERPATP